MGLDFSRYDQRNYPTVDVREGYRRWSASYDRRMTEDLDIWLLARLETLSWSVDHAIDLACGTGRIGAWLAAHGVRRIEGVDLSPEMLAHARARGVYADLHCADIRRTPLAAGVAELVVNVLSIEHLPALAPFYAEVARLCRPGATAVIVGYHPHFLLNGIPTHFPDDGENVAIENTIHLFADHVRAARAHGLLLRELEERLVDDEMVERVPSWKRHHGRPASFAMVWSTQPDGAARNENP
ncbi:MAG TPA: class I SAM-dependent methyltransferase [Kofleriaceae bacterium]|nr:class I SAM-dependent methyltransferase [Kofleriaceae bacterium]